MKYIHPYQNGDFINNERGYPVEYLGPIFDVNYPESCDPMQEMFDWNNLGYRTGGFFGTKGVHNTVVVLGDIPEWLQDGLKKHGVSFKKRKERGIRVNLDSLITT